jgi:hypothetical protein
MRHSPNSDFFQRALQQNESGLNLPIESNLGKNGSFHGQSPSISMGGRPFSMYAR